MAHDDAALNRKLWEKAGPNWAVTGRELWALPEPVWGVWGNAESEITLILDVAGLHAVELGCGTAYVSAWLKRRGAKPVGLDISAAQLHTARMLQEEFENRFPLALADAERTPFEDESFDFAISEYGASTWCDPYRWIPEAARILRPRGRLVFVTATSLMMMCFPDDDESAAAGRTLQREYFGRSRFEWHDHGTVSSVGFQLGHGDMIRLLRSCGFEVEDLIEVRAPVDSTSRVDIGITYDWARRWPTVEAWKARKRSHAWWLTDPGQSDPLADQAWRLECPCWRRWYLVAR